MPSRVSRFLDYETDLVQYTQADPNQYQKQRHHRTSDASGYHSHRNSTTSGPTSTSTTRSSIASQACTQDPSLIVPADVQAPVKPPSRRQRLSRLLDLSDQTPHISLPSLNVSKPTGYRQRDSSSIHSSNNHRPPPQRIGIEIAVPTSPIQEWAHQVHIQQRRKYDWCSGCHPRSLAPTLNVPSEQTVKRVRIIEPTHCYE